MTGRPKTGDELLEIIKEDIVFAQDHFGVTVIGWTTDDGPDGKKARRLLAIQQPHLILTVCWAHQINLVVGDLLSLADISVTISEALEVIKWFNAHSTALDLLRREQLLTSPDRTVPLALILPAITRWTAHFLAFSRLLFLAKAVQLCVMRHHDALLVCAGRAQDAKRKAQEVMDIVGDKEFWTKLIR